MGKKEQHAITKQFAKNVKRYREELGWSQTELAARAGVSRSTISAIELGRNGTKVYTFVRLSVALGRTYSEMYK